MIFIIKETLFLKKIYFSFLTGLLSIMYNICRYMLDVLVVDLKRPKISKTPARRLYRLLSKKKKSLPVDIWCFLSEHSKRFMIKKPYTASTLIEALENLTTRIRYRFKQ